MKVTEDRLSGFVDRRRLPADVGVDHRPGMFARSAVWMCSAASMRKPTSASEVVADHRRGVRFTGVEVVEAPQPAHDAVAHRRGCGVGTSGVLVGAHDAGGRCSTPVAFGHARQSTPAASRQCTSTIRPLLCSCVRPADGATRPSPVAWTRRRRRLATKALRIAKSRRVDDVQQGSATSAPGSRVPTNLLALGAGPPAPGLPSASPTPGARPVRESRPIRAGRIGHYSRLSATAF